MYTVKFYEGRGFIERHEHYTKMADACERALSDDSARIYQGEKRLI